MFTVEQIELAHSQVRSGADFPAYIQKLKSLGVVAFETRVTDSCTTYFGRNEFQTQSTPKYDPLLIAERSDKSQFCEYLRMHQKGETDYFTFCSHCAETGIEKWIVDLEQMTCTYYNKAQNEIHIEAVPRL